MTHNQQQRSQTSYVNQRKKIGVSSSVNNQEMGQGQGGIKQPMSVKQAQQYSPSVEASS
jgi:hypothetical protein